MQKYIGHLGKSQKSKNEVDPESIVKYVHRLLNRGINQEEITSILNKIGIEYDAWPIRRSLLRTT